MDVNEIVSLNAFTLVVTFSGDLHTSHCFSHYKKKHHTEILMSSAIIIAKKNHRKTTNNRNVQNQRGVGQFVGSKCKNKPLVFRHRNISIYIRVYTWKQTNLRINRIIIKQQENVTALFIYFFSILNIFCISFIWFAYLLNFLRIFHHRFKADHLRVEAGKVGSDTALLNDIDGRAVLILNKYIWSAIFVSLCLKNCYRHRKSLC